VVYGKKHKSSHFHRPSKVWLARLSQLIVFGQEFLAQKLFAYSLVDHKTRKPELKCWFFDRILISVWWYASVLTTLFEVPRCLCISLPKRRNFPSVARYKNSIFGGWLLPLLFSDIFQCKQLDTEGMKIRSIWENIYWHWVEKNGYTTWGEIYLKNDWFVSQKTTVFSNGSIRVTSLRIILSNAGDREV